VLKGDGGVFNPIESGGFHHGVVGHVIEDKDIANAEFPVKCEVAHDVTGKAGRTS
jgi:hypothetical protein